MQTSQMGVAAAAKAAVANRHSISELTPVARIHLARTADWVALTDDTVWVGTKVPNGIAQIDARTNTLTAAIALPGNPCAGLAVGFGALWVPLCAKPNALAKVDVRTHSVALVPGVGPADREGGITVSKDSVWLVIDGKSTLARIDPMTMSIGQKILLPRGSLNAAYRDAIVWVTRPTHADIIAVDADNGTVLASVPIGPKPRFLDSDERFVWTLNQGDGTLSRIDVKTRSFAGTSALHTPGKGGDIKVAHGIVWTTMDKVPLTATDASTGKVLCQWQGPGGDSLGVSGDAIWLTDYDSGDVLRFALEDVFTHCPAAQRVRS